jgi:hypothetical protein
VDARRGVAFSPVALLVMPNAAPPPRLHFASGGIPGTSSPVEPARLTHE